VARTREVIRTIDLGLLVLAGNRFDQEEEAILEQLKRWEVPYLLVHNKSDQEPLSESLKKRLLKETGQTPFDFSALHPINRRI
jgi:predicted GTPase